MVFFCVVDSVDICFWEAGLLFTLELGLHCVGIALHWDCIALGLHCVGIALRWDCIALDGEIPPFDWDGMAFRLVAFGFWNLGWRDTPGWSGQCTVLGYIQCNGISYFYYILLLIAAVTALTTGSFDAIAAFLGIMCERRLRAFCKFVTGRSFYGS